MPNKKLIKVHFQGSEMMEHLWAKPMKDNTARLMNIPFQEGISLHDLVRLDENLNIIGVVKRKTQSYRIRYDDKNINENWQILVKYLEENKVFVEGIRVGYASIAIPLNMKWKKFEGIINKSPVKILELGSK